jgi:hypothetical protein
VSTAWSSSGATKNLKFCPTDLPCIQRIANGVYRAIDDPGAYESPLAGDPGGMEASPFWPSQGMGLEVVKRLTKRDVWRSSDKLLELRRNLWRVQHDERQNV